MNIELRRKQLYEEAERKLALEITLDSMKNCNHIFVSTGHERVRCGDEVTHYDYECCIKCGLNSVFYLNDYEYTTCSELYRQQAIIYRDTQKKGITLEPDITCRLDLVQVISTNIINSHPGITDEQLIEYFKAALNDNKTKEAEGPNTNYTKVLV